LTLGLLNNKSTPEKVEFMAATSILTYLNEKNRSNIRLTNVNGSFIDGTLFEGSDLIRVI